MAVTTSSDSVNKRRKTLVALSSVLAAIVLTAMKLGAGLFTGSLGLLAEAAHSGLDFVAALMTFFAVRYAERPPDETHNYGHSKAENLSAFLESLLLLVTAIWVIFESLLRLIWHEGHVEVSAWAFVVMAISIMVDVGRSRVLLRVARQVGSQALEADALHFSTDIWSSVVVIVGLFIVTLTSLFHLPAWLTQADAIAALGVSIIVLSVSGSLMRATVDALLDRAPDHLAPTIAEEISRLPMTVTVRRIRTRHAGNNYFADIVVAASRTLTFEQTHELTEQIENAAARAMQSIQPQASIDTVVHVEPERSPHETISERIHYLATHEGVHAHDIHIRQVDTHLEADFDVEVPPHIALGEAHAIATRIEDALMAADTRLGKVTTHLEAPDSDIAPRREVTDRYASLVGQIQQIADGVMGAGRTHDIHLYCPLDLPVLAGFTGKGEGATPLDVALHIICDADAPLNAVHIQAEEVKRALRRAYPALDTITVHTEPPASQM